MKNYSYSLTVLRSYGLLLLLCCLSFLFYACEQQTVEIPETPDNPELLLTGERIPVNFSVSENAFIGAEENPVELRSVVNLDPGTNVRIIAYIALANDTVYLDHADYYVMSGNLLNPLGSSLTVYPEFTYKFVAYSFDPYNASWMPAVLNPTIPASGGLFPGPDIMWGYTIEAITPSHSTIHVTMNHLTAKVTIQANALPTGIISNEIDSVNVVIIASSPILTVKTGEITPFVSALSSGTFKWIPGSSSSRTSYPVYIVPSNNNNTQLHVNHVIINSIYYNANITPPATGGWPLIYSKPLEAGKSYTLQINMHHAHGGSADRITLEGSGGNAKLVITRDPNDFGIFFKYGSVIGMNTTDAYFSLSTIVYNPMTNTGAISDYSNNDYNLPSVPAYDGVADVNITRNVSSSDYHHLINVRTGKGDPCRLIGMTADEIRGFPDDAALYAREEALKAAGIGGWRLPTSIENQRFSGQHALITYSSHWWDDSGVNQSPFGNPPVAGGEFPERGFGGSAKFLPEAGSRNNYGDLSIYGGYYWSSEAGVYNGGTSLHFSNNSINPIKYEGFYIACPVRCVRDDQSGITLSVEDWGSGGTLGTGGEGDIVLP